MTKRFLRTSPTTNPARRLWGITLAACLAGGAILTGPAAHGAPAAAPADVSPSGLTVSLAQLPSALSFTPAGLSPVAPGALDAVPEAVPAVPEAAPAVPAAIDPFELSSLQLERSARLAGEGGLLTARYVQWLNQRAESFVTSHKKWRASSYYNLCPILASHIHGYKNTGGGYGTAYTWWRGLKAKGLAHGTASKPPAGALLFFGPAMGGGAGHVAVYLGGGKIISSDVNARGNYTPGAVGIFSMKSASGKKSWTGWNSAHYLGWTEPHFTSAKIADRPGPVMAHENATVLRSASNPSKPGSLR